MRTDMDQEILFRGFHKQADGPDVAIIDGVAERGQWVYGYFVENESDLYRTYIVTAARWETDDDGDTDLIETTVYEVEPSTIGQYTGLTDKNGKKIFQGDMVDAPNRNFKGLPAEVKYMPDASFMIRRIGYVPISLENAEDFLVVLGTIYDAPPEGA